MALVLLVLVVFIILVVLFVIGQGFPPANAAILNALANMSQRYPAALAPLTDRYSKNPARGNEKEAALATIATAVSGNFVWIDEGSFLHQAEAGACSWVLRKLDVWRNNGCEPGKKCLR